MCGSDALPRAVCLRSKTRKWRVARNTQCCLVLSHLSENKLFWAGEAIKSAGVENLSLIESLMAGSQTQRAELSSPLSVGGAPPPHPGGALVELSGRGPTGRRAARTRARPERERENESAARASKPASPRPPRQPSVLGG